MFSTSDIVVAFKSMFEVLPVQGLETVARTETRILGVEVGLLDAVVAGGEVSFLLNKQGYGVSLMTEFSQTFIGFFA